VAVAPEPVKQDLIDNEILESVPKTMKAKVQLLLKKMKSSPDISWNEKEELKYKGETVQESNVVELVNDVLSKRKYFNPQGWETSDRSSLSSMVCILLSKVSMTFTRCSTGGFGRSWVWWYLCHKKDVTSRVLSLLNQTLRE
jgi:hypothetical protein